MDCFHQWRTSMRLVWWRIKLDQKWHSQGTLEHNLPLPQVLEKKIHLFFGSSEREKTFLPIKRLMDETQMFLVIMNCTFLALPANTKIAKSFSERNWWLLCAGEGRDLQAHPAPGWDLWGWETPKSHRSQLEWLVITFPGKQGCADTKNHWSLLKISARVTPEQRKKNRNLSNKISLVVTKLFH